MTNTVVDNSADIIDSRVVIDRIAELKTSRTGLDEDEAAEVVALLALEDEASDCAPDWEYGATLVRDTYFVTYAQEVAEEIGAVPSNYSWPASHIDWEAAATALRQDYTAVDFDGVTYWIS